MKDECTEEIIKMFEEGPSETVVLSDDDFEKLLEVIENPPEPSEKMRELMNRRKRWEGDW